MARCQRRLGRLDEAEYSFKVLAGQPARLAMCVLDRTGPVLWLMVEWGCTSQLPALPGAIGCSRPSRNDINL